MTSNNWNKATGTSLNGYYTPAALVAVLPIITKGNLKA